MTKIDEPLPCRFCGKMPMVEAWYSDAKRYWEVSVSHDGKCIEHRLLMGVSVYDVTLVRAMSEAFSLWAKTPSLHPMDYDDSNKRRHGVIYPCPKRGTN